MKIFKNLNVRCMTAGGLGKKTGMLGITLALMLSLLSCTKDDDKSSGRNQFIGSYTYVSEGALTITYQGQNIKIPQSGSGLFTISASEEPSKVILRMPDGSSQEYLVKGNNLTTTYQESETDEDADLQYTVVSNASLSGKTLTIMETYSGITVIQGYTGTVSGSATIIATKQ